MHSRYIWEEDPDHGRAEFMDTHHAPSLYSVSYHPHNHHLPQEPQVIFGQPVQDLSAPAMFQLNRVALEVGAGQEAEQLHPGYFKHAGLQSGVNHHAIVPFSNGDFRLGLNPNSSCNMLPCYTISTEAQLHPNQQDRLLHFKELPRTLSIEDSHERTTHGIENKGSIMFGELEAVCNLAKNQEMNKTCSSSALTGENPAQIMPLGAIKDPKVVPEEDNNHGSSSSKSVCPRKAERRKRKQKEELRSTSLFVKALLKQVMDHQDFLQRKFLQVIEKMERDRTEREDEWRRVEAQKHESEAAARARDLALASSREALIVAYIQKISDQGRRLS